MERRPVTRPVTKIPVKLPTVGLAQARPNYIQVKTCDKCQRNNGKLQKQHAPLHPDETWWQVGMDLVGSLPETARGYKYIMTLTDYYTKWAEAAALKDKSASSVADVLYSISFQNSE